MGNFRCGVEGVKRFMNVRLHCIVSNQKRISNMSSLPPPGKFSADAHVCSDLLLGRDCKVDIKKLYLNLMVPNQNLQFQLL